MTTILLALMTASGVAVQDTVPHYDNLGDHHYAITTDVAEAQAYFDQGLRLYYAFNHGEAIRSFRAAQALDPACAMCYWGEALSWGPNINLPQDSASHVAAYAAIADAVGALDDETAVEEALVRAQATRYVAAPPADRAPLDSAYARSMAEVVRTYPDDPEARVLYGESLMDLRPWNYWTAEGELQPGMAEALESFQAVTEENPEHPGACHFYIHAVEAVHPEWAVTCAERLARLMPGAGHLVHMPGHIYIRVGRYADAIEANEHAIHADESYIRDQRPGVGMYTLGYYPHNYDFMAFGAAMAGRSDMAVSSADRIPEIVPPEMIGAPGMGFLEHWITRGLQMRVRFGMWDEILATPAPDTALHHARAMWHWARGRALAGQGRAPAARAELTLLLGEAAHPTLEGLRMEFNLSRDILGVAEQVLRGRIAEADGDLDAAVEALRVALAREGALLYGEPPEWSIPVRHELGAVLLAAGRPAEAEEIYREDLDRFRENGWSLLGLALALEAQGRQDEAADARARFAEAWRAADVEISSSSL
jgi:tetratricopeptide (TPR) repeat protein